MPLSLQWLPSKSSMVTITLFDRILEFIELNRLTVVYNKQINQQDMILHILLFALLTFCKGDLVDIRTGIYKLEMGDSTKADYTIVFKNSLSNSQYKTAIFLSFISNFDFNLGMHFISYCPITTKSSMQCNVQSTNHNKYSKIYVSYIASGFGSFIVGSYQKTFLIDSNSTQIYQDIKFKSNIDKAYINETNSLFVNAYSSILGFKSDGLFSLKLQSIRLDMITDQISFTLTLKSANSRQITIIFGYQIIDPLMVTVSFYQGLSIIPGSIASGYIYGIQSIHELNSFDNLSTKNRNLQINQITNKKQKFDRLIFYDIFRTNGFFILTQVQDIDHIYFYQVSLVNQVNNKNK